MAGWEAFLYGHRSMEAERGKQAMREADARKIEFLEISRN